MYLKDGNRTHDSLIVLGTQHFPSFLIKGDRYALIETGISCSAVLAIQQFQDLGLDPCRVEYLLVMHAHPDHVTGIPYLLEAFPEAKVVGSATAQKVLSKEKAVRSFYMEDQVLTSALLARGEISAPASQRTETSIPVHVTVKQGDELDLGRDCQLKILETPGHSPCSLSVFWPSNQALFISDAGGFLASPSRNFPCFFSGFQTYLDSLQRLKQLAPQIIIPAHNPMVLGEQAAAQHLEMVEQAALQMGRKIFESLRCGEEFGVLVEKIFQEQYQDDLTLYSEKNIRGCIEALVSRIAETGDDYFKPGV